MPGQNPRNGAIVSRLLPKYVTVSTGWKSNCEKHLLQLQKQLKSQILFSTRLTSSQRTFTKIHSFQNQSDKAIAMKQEVNQPATVLLDDSSKIHAVEPSSQEEDSYSLNITTDVQKLKPSKRPLSFQSVFQLLLVIVSFILVYLPQGPRNIIILIGFPLTFTYFYDGSSQENQNVMSKTRSVLKTLGIIAIICGSGAACAFMKMYAKRSR